MTPMGTRLVRRVLTVVAAMMIVAGVIAMHSFLAGHAPMAQPGRASAAAPPHAMVMTAHAHASDPESMSDPAPIPLALALTGPTSPTAHDLSAMCLAVLPALLLVFALALLRLHRRRSMVPSRRGVLLQWVGIRGSPPRRTTPSLSQLCVLRT